MVENTNLQFNYWEMVSDICMMCYRVANTRKHAVEQIVSTISIHGKPEDLLNTEIKQIAIYATFK